uniref:Uncharacterized protein n=1 Tax=Leersia perrieri TaxID=77586 RepID=A0A0D9WCL1_9ORYZ
MVIQKQPPISFAVRRRKPELVGPSTPTPRETKRLSDLDDHETLRVHVKFAFFYRAGGDDGDDAAAVIRRALGDALVPYYPLAGRLREIDGRKLVVDCTGEGILFVEADADVRMDELEEEEDDVMAPPFPEMEQLLFDVEASAAGVVDSPLMLVQVTRLLCGGFVLAVRLNHAMCDAIGFSQFLLAVANIARGLPGAAPPLPWRRELLDARIPPAPSFPHHEFDAVSPPPPQPQPCDVIVTRTFTFAPTDIAKIKNRLPATATAFEAVTAFLWRARTAALEIAGEETIRLVIIANLRGVAGLNLPGGYYGNACVSPTAITTAGKLLRHGGGALAVEMVKEAKKSVTAEYARSAADALVMRRRPLLAMGNLFVVSDHRHAGFHRLDFGWGSPVYGGVAETVFGLSFLVAVKDAVAAVVSLPAPAMERFASEMETFYSGKFIESYVDSLLFIKQNPMPNTDKRKHVLSYANPPVAKCYQFHAKTQKWEKPVRSNGPSFQSWWRTVVRCYVQLLGVNTGDKSSLAFVIREAKEIMSETRNIVLSKVHRSQNDESKSKEISLPEEHLNIVILCTAFVYKAMNGLGTLATIWATVVLLGGFSTLIKKQDFWYVTAIAFVQSIGYAVEMVKEAKKSVTTEYARSAADVLVMRRWPLLAMGNLFVVSDHRHAGF